MEHQCVKLLGNLGGGGSQTFWLKVTPFCNHKAIRLLLQKKSACRILQNQVFKKQCTCSILLRSSLKLKSSNAESLRLCLVYNINYHSFYTFYVRNLARFD